MQGFVEFDGIWLLWMFWTWNILNFWMMFIILTYNSLLMVIVRPGTSPSDIHAFTLDYHLQSWQDGESFRNRDILNSLVWNSFIFLMFLHVWHNWCLEVINWWVDVFFIMKLRVGILYWSSVCAVSSINKLVKFEISNKNWFLQFIILTMSHVANP